MKQCFFIMLGLLLFASFLQASSLGVFNEEYHVPKSIIIAFDANAVGTTRGEVNVNKNRNNQISIGRFSFDKIAEDNDFIEIERLFMVENHEWKDTNGTHIMNIFRVTLRDNENMEQALLDLSNNDNIIWAEFEGLISFFNVPTDDVNGRWNFRNDIQLPQMWNYLSVGHDVVVAIVDSGVKWNHEYLRNSMFVDNSQIFPYRADDNQSKHRFTDWSIWF